MRLSPAAFAALVACGGASSDPPNGSDGSTDSSNPDSSQIADTDNDGLDDAYELMLATKYVPFISLDPGDGCSRSGLAVRVRKHPADPTKIHIVYDHLFETDCGFNGHTGDNEAFGVLIDPAKPAPDGILAIRTASHQNTPCEKITDCTTCSNDSRAKCDRQAIAGVMFPVIYASKGKHGQYANKCSSFGTCLDTCTLNSMPHLPPIANVGEPDHHMISNLTTQGFITMGNGWTKPELMNFDPWAPKDFGSAGQPAEDFIDDTFTPALCP